MNDGRYEPGLKNTLLGESPEPDPFVSFFRMFFSRFDWFQIVPMVALLAIGALFIYGTGQQVGGVHATIIWKRQLIYMGVGTVFWFFFIFFDYRWLIPFTFIIYPAALGLLAAVLSFGKVLYGARRWLSIGGISVQPSEFGKLAVLLAVSWLLSRKKADVNKIVWMALVAAVTAGPFLLILREPDLGTALVLLPVVGAIVFTAKLKMHWIVLAVVLVTASVPIVYSNLKPYQRERVETFLNPESDPQNRGWNSIQAELAVGRGGISGKGFMQGTHCSLGYLPTTVANSDFIFPVIAEETGVIGTIGLLILYGI